MTEPLHILVTGAGGFVGQRLVRALLAQGHLGERAIGTITALDQVRGELADDPRLRFVEGSMGDAAVRDRALQPGVDVVFHLAAVPGGAAERDYALGHAVNVQATQALFEALREQPRPPVVVYTSTIGVYGVPLPRSPVDDRTPTHPTMSYGTQKLMMEATLSDFSRRGWLDGRAVRLPGVLARPRQPNGLLSAYLSDVFSALRAGERFTLPVAAHSTSWVMSVSCVVRNLIHAASLSPDTLPAWRAWNLPALCLRADALVDALADVLGDHVRELVSYAPNEALEAQFGRYPPLLAETADRLGFQHDGDAVTLVRNVLAQLGPT
ncbi:NAD-dependent epimerase/dehydratase family protein [Dyella sp. C9]|uniref:NAD-dependent epimerase/dehydratase family protein n=1 Tax=Dyella sp. C9 TaxID=2202154 RepID=UPI0018E5A1FB|nr:NAD-dependent epimerase/dehydratase family protein [Dyella sp. C9]